jgi:hypothetical protein
MVAEWLVANQIGHRAACHAIQEPHIQHSRLPTAPRPFPPPSASGSFLDIGHECQPRFSDSHG